jgi:hypothetical protein
MSIYQKTKQNDLGYEYVEIYDNAPHKALIIDYLESEGYKEVKVIE